MGSHKGIFCISLDLELYWGMHDVVSESDFYQVSRNTQGNAIPAILDIFQRNGIHATWAAVGGMFSENRKEFFENAPSESKRPTYEIKNLSSYRLFTNDSNVLVDDMLFAKDLIELIKACPYQEIGTHTFSHYYCTAQGQNIEQFEADLDAALIIDKATGVQTKSIVFPRNQVAQSYLKACRAKGILAYRGIESNWIYNKVKSRLLQRVLRMVDTYFPISGSNVHEPEIICGMVNIVGSRILRPFNRFLRIFEPLKIHRIKKQMLAAAKEGKIFHLWWHPHNFGLNTERNLAILDKVMKYYVELREKYDFENLNMGEIAERFRLGIVKTYGPISESRTEDIAIIYNSVFDGEATGKSVHRKHFENPAAVKPQIHGAYDGDKLIGVNGFLDMEYVYNGMKFKAIQSCDTAVDCFYRNQGIFSSIIKDKEKQLLEEGYDLIVGYPNFNSYPGFLKMGWQEITRTSKLFLPIDAQKIIKHMVGVNPTKLANLLSWLLWKKIERVAKRNGELTVEKKNTITVSEYNECVDTRHIYFHVDDEMLKWKLADMSGHFVLKKKEKILGRIITVRTGYKDGMRRTNLVAFHFDVEAQGIIEVMIAKVLCRLRKEFDIICVWCPDDKLIANALHNLHFLQNIATRQGSPFIIKILTKDYEKIKILNNKTLWKPCQLETDTMVNL